MQLQPRVLGNFKFTYTSAGNLHTRVLANAIANLPIHGKSILYRLIFEYIIRFRNAKILSCQNPILKVSISQGNVTTYLLRYICNVVVFAALLPLRRIIA